MTATGLNTAQMAERVKLELLHAWRGYERYAWGHDDLRPLSYGYRDWYGQALLMTPVDALDTMILMGLDHEVEKARDLILRDLSFDKDFFVSNFEITIRLLGGLRSSYQLMRDRGLLDMAEDLGTRLLPAFDSPTGVPYRFVNLRSGAVRDPETNPAEAGTLLLEFGTLARLTKKPRFYDEAKRALTAVFDLRSPLGLVGERIHAETGEWLAFGDSDCRKMWEESIRAINRYLADEVGIELWYGHADMRNRKRTSTTFGALDAFFPAVLALSGDIDRASRLQASCFKMWTMHEIEPERFNYWTQTILNGRYPLRPEVAESAYYLFQLTKDRTYLEMGKTVFESIVRHCRSDAGYASLQDIVSKEKSDEMHSFCLSETFKYLYLLFVPPKTMDCGRVIFTTEAHPIKRAV